MLTNAQIQENQELADELGNIIAEALTLKKGKDGRYQTTWGTKTAAGLARMLSNILSAE
jgi:hypothetical protein